MQGSAGGIAGEKMERNQHRQRYGGRFGQDLGKSTKRNWRGNPAGERTQRKGEGVGVASTGCRAHSASNLGMCEFGGVVSKPPITIFFTVWNHTANGTQGWAGAAWGDSTGSNVTRSTHRLTAEKDHEQYKDKNILPYLYLPCNISS